jgi:hypothetical protein
VAWKLTQDIVMRQTLLFDKRFYTQLYEHEICTAKLDIGRQDSHLL